MKKRIKAKLTQAKIASEDSEMGRVTFRASVGRQEVWKAKAQEQGLTLTQVIVDLLNAWVGEEGAVGARGTKQVVREAEKQRVAEERAAEEQEKQEILLAANTYCWPCGEIRKITQAERAEGKFAKHLVWVDEAGRCYDADLYQWRVDGSYAADLQVGAGKLRYKRTILASWDQGWRPKHPMSELTRERMLYVLRREDKDFSWKMAYIEGKVKQ